MPEPHCLTIVKIKSLLRSKVHFLQLESEVEEVKRCILYQKQPGKLNIIPKPNTGCDTINIDYLGPLPNRSYLLVTTDQTSKYPDVEIIRNTTYAQQPITAYGMEFQRRSYSTITPSFQILQHQVFQTL